MQLRNGATGIIDGRTDEVRFSQRWGALLAGGILLLGSSMAGCGDSGSSDADDGGDGNTAGGSASGGSGGSAGTASAGAAGSSGPGSGGSATAGSGSLAGGGLGSAMMTGMGRSSQQYETAHVSRNGVPYILITNGWGPGFESHTIAWNGTSFLVEAMSGMRGSSGQPASYPTVFCGRYSVMEVPNCGLPRAIDQITSLKTAASACT
jgi:hypothetical protein